MSGIDNPIIASNSFGIDLEGTFRTAAFGGEALTVENNITHTPDVIPKGFA